MMKLVNNSTGVKRVTTFAVIFAAVAGGFGIYQYNINMKFRRQMEANYQRAFTELAQSVDNIDVLLTKIMVTNNENQLSQLSADLWREASFAKSNLGQLPIANTQLDNTANFLSQIGNYTYSLSKKISSGQQITDEETAQLESLLEFSNTLNDDLKIMENRIFNGELQLAADTSAVEKTFANQEPNFGSDMDEVEKKFSEYVSLIYDGPFSEHTMNKKSKMLEAQPEISQENAIKITQDFLSSEDISSVEVTGEGYGNIPVFEITASSEDKAHEVYVEVTKRGGYVRLAIDNRNVMDASMSIEDASAAASDFLTKNGIESMVETGYIISGNSVDFAFAYQDDYLAYTDLVKVKIALDNGQMVGYEANSYLINHFEEKNFPSLPKSIDEAREKIKPQLQIDKINKCMIPLETGQNVFCYEFKVNYKEKTFLIYINVENLREEKILMFVENEQGSLTI